MFANLTVVLGLLGLIHRRDSSTTEGKEDGFSSSCHDSVPSLMEGLLLSPSLEFRGLDQMEGWPVITTLPFLLHSCPPRLTPSFTLVPEKAPNPLAIP